MAPKKQRIRTPEEKMALSEHLRELRKRVIIIVGILFLSMILGFIWYDLRIGNIPSLGEILRGPYCAIPPEGRLQLGDDNTCRLLATGPFEQFMLRLKVGSVAGIVFTSPFWLYQVWAFIAPGLYKKEKKFALLYVGVASLLFICGAVLAYFIVAKALDFLLNMGNNVQITALSGTQYFNFIIALIAIFGISFELPLLIVTLNIMGVVSYEQLKKWRRVAILALFCFAAFVTPGGDPISMTALALTLTVLQEIAIQICRVHDKRKKKERPDWLATDDAAASPLESPDAITSDGATTEGEEVTPSPLAAPTSLPDNQPLLSTDIQTSEWTDIDVDDEEPSDNGSNNASH
ncbi:MULTISPECIES: twin-arginine translocase subunit TatC [Lawsonella]|nr:MULTISPECIES: twin-arginine translocase subunit TatC [Lawsonella]